MSRQNYERDMDRPVATSGSVKRARERAQAGLPRQPPPPIYQQDAMDDTPPGDLRAPPRRPMVVPPNQPRNLRVRTQGNDARNISRPTQVPQWPLPGPPLAAVNQNESEPYRPPPGRPQQAPQRPPRPSQVPSMLDQSRLQDPTPVFLNPDADYYSDSPTSPSSQASSNFGEPRDLPTAAPSHSNGQTRRSANLGPPPSSRRGASSFYSNQSFVSPIPEESLASRSHRSYASSAAMPEAWPMVSPEGSPTFYDETTSERSQASGYDDITDESKLVRSASIGKRGKPALVNTYDDFADESRLVRSASIGKRGKPALVTTKSSSSGSSERQVQTPTQAPKSSQGNRDPQNSWIAMTTPDIHTDEHHKAPTPDAILGAYAAASATDLAENRIKSPEPVFQPSIQPQVPHQPQYNRLSAIRRPPRLDIDAVRSMEERGSMTSLPDLIRRATRLAGMIDRGRRPASRFDDLNDYFDEKGQIRGEEKENSGLSDMLAAFPPPAQAQTDRQSRGSWFRTTSWPLAPNSRDGLPPQSGLRNVAREGETKKNKRRKCCGLPIWAFILLTILLLAIIAAAIVVPLEFFVFKNLGNKDSSTSALAQCQESLTCQNGGTNVISGGTCSCICTNGFTGSDCGTSGSAGCTTTDLVSSDEETISNVTLGKSIPRLISYSSSNFSIPLSGTAVLARFNSNDLSCIAQNSLVTFDGSSTRNGDADDKVTSTKKKRADKRSDSSASVTSVLSVSPDMAATTLVLDQGSPTITATATSSATSVAADATTTSSSAESTATFTVTEEVLDFARVAVLYILQEESLSKAESAQTSLQDFFTEADTSSGVTQGDASSLKIGDDNVINLVSYSLDIGNGTVTANSKRDIVDNLTLRFDEGLPVARRGGSVLPSR